MPNVNLGTANIAIRARDRNTAQVAGRTANQLRNLNTRIRNTRAAARQANTAVRNFNRALAGVGLGAGLLTGRLGQIVRSSAELGANLVEASGRIGITVEQFQQLQRVFEGDGLAADAFEKAMQRLANAITQGGQGLTTYLRVFERLGIELRNSEGELRGVREILFELADALPRVNSETERLGLIQQILGTRSAAVLTVLNRGSDALRDSERQAGALGVVSQENAEILKELAQTFTDVGNAIRVDLANTIARTAGDLTVLAAQSQRIAEGMIDAGEAAVTLGGGLRDLGISAAAIGIGLRVYTRVAGLLSRALIRLRGGATILQVLGNVARSLIVVAARMTAVLAGAYAAGQLLIEWLDSYNRETVRAETNTVLLNNRLEELQERLADTADSFSLLDQIAGTGAFNPLRFLSARNALNEIDLIRNQLRGLQEEQLLFLGPGAGGEALLPPLPQPEPDTPAPGAEGAQRTLVEFARERVELYRELARLSAQVDIPEVVFDRPALPETDLDRRFREAVSPDPAAAREVRTIADLYARVGTAVRNAAEAQGGLADDQERILRAVAATANNRFADVELIRQGTDAAERGLRAQAESGEITRQTLEASLIVNRRIASLSDQVLTATGEEREQIARVLEDLNTRYPEIVERIASAMGEVAEETRNQVTALSTITEGFARGLERGILRAVREGGKLRDIFAAIGREITGTILSGLTRFAVNSLFTAIGLPGFGGGRQFGGLALPGRVYRVHQDELIVPANPARVIPAGAGGNNVSIAIDARGSDEASFQASLNRAIPQLAEIFRADAVNTVQFALNNPSPIFQGS